MRRHPSKRSGEEIVDAILASTAAILDRDGIEGLTTNRIARAAGVSVGSLYQYFPDKNAIVAEIARRIEAASLTLTREEMVRLSARSARAVISRVVSLSCAPAFGTARVRRVLLREVPRGWTLEVTRATDAFIGQAIAAFFMTRADELRVVNLSCSVFVVQHAVEGVVEAVLLTQPEALPEAKVQDEIFRLAWAHFAPDGDDLARPPIDLTGLLPVETPNPALIERLLDEPSRRIEIVRRAPASQKGATTRDAVLDAAERVLTRDGYAQSSARAIVAEAELSIGGLYRHFASVPAIFAALATRYEARAAEALDLALASLRADPTLMGRSVSAAQTARAIVGAYLGALEVMPRALLTEIPRRWTEEAVMPLHRATIERLANASAAPELRAFIVFHAIRSAWEAYVLLAPPGLSRESLTEELITLATRYMVAN